MKNGSVESRFELAICENSSLFDRPPPLVRQVRPQSAKTRSNALRRGLAKQTSQK